MADEAKPAEKKQTYCHECHCWTPKVTRFGETPETAAYGRCSDLKQRTMRLDFCDTDKIPKPKEMKKR